MADDVVWVESRSVEETAVEKEKKVFVGSQKTPWWPDLKQERLPCSGHQLYVCVSAHRGVQGSSSWKSAGSKSVTSSYFLGVS